MNKIYSRSALALAVLIWGCSDPRGLVQNVSPLNGTTLVNDTVQPVIELTGSAGVDGQNRRVVLYEVTGGAKLSVGGEVVVEGPVITYEPNKPLKRQAEFSLEVLESAITGDEFDRVDATEGPVDEVLNFKEPVLYNLRFSTRSCPRVRAAYHQVKDDGTSRIIVRFTQKMSSAATSKSIAVVENTFKKTLPAHAPVFTSANNMDVHVDLKQALDKTQIYTLWINKTATSADNTGIDGNGNFKPGEANDHFYMKFTGAQSVIYSRLQTDKSSTKL